MNPSTTNEEQESNPVNSTPLRFSLGGSLSSIKKPIRIIRESALGEDEVAIRVRNENIEYSKVEVQVMEGGKLDADVLQEELKKQKLVIPLQSTDVSQSWQSSISTKHTTSIPRETTTISKILEEKELTEEEKLLKQAEAELLRGVSVDELSNSNEHVKLIIDSSGSTHVEKTAPLLANRIAQSMAASASTTSDNDRFKKTLEEHPDDVDVYADSYSKIPIGEFGAALLRGMGWKDPETSSETKPEEKITARPSRLGLGAQPKPMDDRNGRKKGDHSANNNTPKPTYSSSSSVEKGDYVWLQQSGEWSGKRAMVIQTSGVAGLNKINVRSETTGELISVSRQAAIRLSEKELRERPFNKKYIVEAEEKERKKLDAERERRLEEERKLLREEEEARRELDRNKRSEDEKKQYSKKQSKGSHWVRPGIRVKIVSKRHGDSVYLKKGTITDVYLAGVSTVLLDNGALIEEVHERHMETVMPPIGGQLIVLRGEYQGETATLVKRYDDEQRVQIQLEDSLDMQLISMDDIGWIVKSNEH